MIFLTKGPTNHRLSRLRQCLILYLTETITNQ